MKQETTIGVRLRTIMEEQGLGYEQLGDRLHMNPQTLNRYVLGQREPKIGTAAAIARALGVDPLWLQGFDVPRIPTPVPRETTVVPILGTIRAGVPLLAQQDLEGYAAADVPDPEEHFYLRVTGNLSLIHILHQHTSSSTAKVIVPERMCFVKKKYALFLIFF